jgi:hypothetical protein
LRLDSPSRSGATVKATWLKLGAGVSGMTGSDSLGLWFDQPRKSVDPRWARALYDPEPVTADEVVANALANLRSGPTWFVGEQLREGARQLSALPRSEAVRMMIQMSGSGVMEAKQHDEVVP